MEDGRDNTTDKLGNPVRKTLIDIVREGVEKILKVALEYEVEEFIRGYCDLVDDRGHKRVVRNGYHRGREFITQAGSVEVRVPRVRDREGEIKYQSTLIPPYLRRAKQIEQFIPFLYLKGVSTGDFSEVLSCLLGEEVSISPSTVVRLKERWIEEYREWNDRDLSEKRYVYWWVDGIHFNVRLQEDRTCILVIIGSTEDGNKELVAIEDGYRESELSWRDILMGLKRRGLNCGPSLAVGDGGLGFWAALRKEFPRVEEQRCWVHKMANVLDKMPKAVQKQAKRKIKDIYMAPTKDQALGAFDEFVELYGAKYPKACECLLKDKDTTMSFYGFPAQHWIHIRSINPIESTFATVRLRTYKTKGCGSREATLMMVFKLVESAQKRWRKLNGYELMPLVVKGIRFEDGVLKEAA